MASPERYEAAKRIFLAARGLPEGERTRFVTLQCEGVPELNAQVRRLLRADAEDSSFLETPALGPGLPDLHPGVRLGRYKLVRLLGEGGMGVVYEAMEDEPARRVALKLIRPGEFSARLRSRFRQEVRVLGLMQHPGITQVYAAGTVEWAGETVPFLAIELIDGRPLLEYAAARGLEIRDRLLLIAQVCDAAHYAHQKGVIHRDLKPGNILVAELPTSDAGESRAGTPMQVKVLDFGVARAVSVGAEERTEHTVAGQLIGTLQYMSPEQIAGDPEGVDIRSDVYSIGLIAYELLSGRPPYAVRGAGLAEAARIIREQDPPWLGAADRSLRGDVETIVARALEKDAARRYQSSGEMAADIRRHLQDEPILARPASAMYQLGKFARRNKALVAASLVALGGMTGGTAVSVWQAREAVRAEHVAERERDRANASAAVARRESYRAGLAAAAAAIENAEPITARSLLSGTDALSRDWAWSYWNARLDESVACTRVDGRIVGADLAAGSLVVVTRDGRILRGEPYSGQLSLMGRLEEQDVYAACLTDAGTLIAVTGAARRTLAEFASDSGRMVRRIAMLPSGAGLLRASADGSVVVVGLKRIVGAAPADDTLLFRRGSSDTPFELSRAERTSDLALSESGRWLVRGVSSAVLWDTGTLTGRRTPEFDRGFMRFAVSAGGQMVAFGGEDKLLHLWEPWSAGSVAGTLRAPLRGHAGSIRAVAVSAGGEMVATAGHDLTVRLWDAVRGEAAETLMGHDRPVSALRYAADGTLMSWSAGDGTVRLWRSTPDEGTIILRGHESFVYSVCFTPDGEQIVSGAWDGSVRVWDSASGSLLRTFEGAGGFSGEDTVRPITSIALSADGSTIAAAYKIAEWERPLIRFFGLKPGGSDRRRAFVPRGRGEVAALLFGADGESLIVACHHDGLPWMTLTGEERRFTRMGEPRSMAASPDGRRLAVGTQHGLVAVLDAETGEVIASFKGHERPVRALAFSPDGATLASGSEDTTVRLWDSQSGASAGVLEGHWGAVYALSFSPDGTRLVSGSEDTTIRMWAVEHGEEITQLRGHREYVYSLAFSPDGTRLVSGSGDRTVRVWDTRPVHERWRARGGP